GTLARSAVTSTGCRLGCISLGGETRISDLDDPDAVHFVIDVEPQRNAGARHHQAVRGRFDPVADTVCKPEDLLLYAEALVGGECFLRVPCFESDLHGVAGVPSRLPLFDAFQPIAHYLLAFD